MKVLVSGANGFAASHLIERLIKSGHDVVGTTRIRSDKDNIKHLEIDLLNMDLNDPFGVDDVIKRVKPDALFHLAAQSFVGWSWSHPQETIQANVMGTLYVLEAVRKHCPDAKIHIASSSQVYGKIDLKDQPMGKKTLFNPMNPYDLSKLSQDMLGLQYFNSYGLNIVRTRAFNISGPRRGQSFAESSWAKQIAEIEIKGSGTIKYGNLESFRDYVDVRDVVIAYEKACFEGTPGEVYILGSGKPWEMSAVLYYLISKSRVSIKSEKDPLLVRPSDTPYMRAGDSSLIDFIKKEPIPLETSLTDLLNFWRDKVSEKNLACHG